MQTVKVTVDTIATEFAKKSQHAIRLYLNCPEGLNKR